MHLLGSTAVEDKLQEGVPQTISALQVAGIKVREDVECSLLCRRISEGIFETAFWFHYCWAIEVYFSG